MLQSIILAGVAVMLSGICQILLKYGAISEKKSYCFPEYLKPYLNRYTLSGYCLLLVVTIISVVVLQEMPLKLFFPLFISMNIIVVVILSYFILHEPLTCRKKIAIGIIVFGILIFCI
ncbi:MAG: hypothetical protein WC593_03900 [Methanoregula sp.]